MLSERFNKAYEALIQAYHNNELRSGDCEACAVGNICREAALIKGIDPSAWVDVFYTAGGSQSKMWSSTGKINEGLELIKETGYSWKELAAVEYAFEINTVFKGVWDSGRRLTEQEILEDQFNGLSKVIDVLLNFEEQPGSDQPFKDRMKAHPKLVTQN